MRSTEEIFYEGGPAKADLIFNLLLGLTLIGIPFAFGAIVRAIWLRFLISDRRVSVSGGWLGRDRTQVSYNQIKEIRSVSRGFGAWGDMVIVLRDGSTLEMRSLPKYKDIEAYLIKNLASLKSNGQVSDEKNARGFS
uniref:PCC 0729 n=1 Tax=Paulinella micropora TaxID=1928728 RepID=A0A1L5YCQ3_9EUKA|nr:PCC 0729 [Paulinella micropora]